MASHKPKMASAVFEVYKTRVTPDYARELLHLYNTANRGIRRGGLKRLIDEMKAGRWKFNGSPIRFAKDGTMLDGQHTLLACAESGVIIECVFMKGLDRDVFDTIDVGTKRTCGDTLYVAGEKNPSILAAALGWVHRYMTNSVPANEVISSTKIEEVLLQHAGIRESLQLVGGLKVKIMPLSILVALHYLFARKDALLAEAFIDAVISGANLAPGDPVYMLRERLLSNMISNRKVRAAYLMALAIKAWNAMRKSKPIKQLSWRGAGEDAPEVFPIIE